MCAGGRLAESEIKALLVRLLQDWRFEWDPPQQDYKYMFATMMKASPFPKLSFKSVK